MSKVLVFAHAVNNILSQYIEIQNEIFKPSWRKIIPIPGIFKSINYNLNEKKLKQFIYELELIQANLFSDLNLSQQEEDFLNCLEDYIDQLEISMYKLVEICYKLDLKANKQYYYDCDEYNKDIDKYNDYVQSYLAIGITLNKLSDII